MKGPYPVQEVIAYHSAQETGAVGNILIQTDFFPAHPGNAKVYENAGKSDDTEFQEFPKQVIVHGTVAAMFEASIASD